MSLSKKTVKWLSKNCLHSLQGKTVLITGANSGIGFKEAETMLYLGANVVMACRNPQKAAAARDALLKDYPDANVTLMQLDMADFSSIDAFSKRLIEEKIDVDVFVNNAGVFHQPNQKTANGFELVLGTNYLGVYYLTERILPYLSSLPHEVRYVNTISIIHKIGKIRYEDFYCEKRYNNFRVYARSKLCLARYSYALANKCLDTNVRVAMIHPGISMTPLGVNGFGGIVQRLAQAFKGCFNSPEKSSLALAYVLEKEIQDGSIIGPNAFWGGWGYPKKNRVLRKVKVGADELIAFTEKAVKQ